MADKADEFPFDYEKTNLFDELKLRAYRQRLQELQKKNSGSTLSPGVSAQLLDAASNMQASLKDVEIKRAAFFNEKTVDARFDLKGQLKNYGFLGKLISFFLTRNY